MVYNLNHFGGLSQTTGIYLPLYMTVYSLKDSEENSALNIPIED